MSHLADGARLILVWGVSMCVLLGFLALVTCDKREPDGWICLENDRGGWACFAPCDEHCETRCLTFEILRGSERSLVDLCVPDAD